MFIVKLLAIKNKNFFIIKCDCGFKFKSHEKTWLVNCPKCGQGVSRDILKKEFENV